MKGIRTLLVFLLALAALLYVAFRLWSGSSRPVNVLFIAVDTLRADRLGCYGWREDTSPHIDALAEGGVLFQSMICQVPQTLPSFCTMLTGTYPMTHGVRANGFFALPPDAVTLAEVFRGAGYRTAAFIGGFPLDGRFGTDQGFEAYWDEMEADRDMTGLVRKEDGSVNWLGHATKLFENTADRVTDEALAWLGREQHRPFFMMVHYFDPHHDYAPPARFEKAFPHPYSGEVAFTDEQVGRLLKKLDASGLARNTLVILTADHGECLGEYGRYYHQSLLWEASVHVPFVLRLPGRLPEGLQVPGRCRTVDIAPTVLDLAGLGAPASMQGASLVPAVGSGRVEPLPCYFETLYGLLENRKGVKRKGISLGNWKLVHNRKEDPVTGAVKEAFELYDLARDPMELQNLAGLRTDQLKESRALLERFLKAHPPGQATTLAPDEDTREALKSLGY